MIDLPSIMLALCLGIVLERSSMCTVANIERLIVKRQVRGLLGLGIAVSWSGVVLLGLAVVSPDVQLPSEYSLSSFLFVGAVLIGIGSAVNGGCFVGSVVRAGSGDLNFLATLIGIGAGMRLLEGWLQPQDTVAAFIEPSGRAIAWSMFLLIGTGALIDVVRRRQHQSLTWRGRWPRAFTLSAAGVLAGLMFARNPNWTYSVAIEQLSHASTQAIDTAMLAAPTALFAGAVLGSRLSGRFELQRPTLKPALRCMAGGALMGAGATMVPGGNDTLLLWSIPGMTVYGVVAYVVMTVTIAAAVFTMRR